MVRSDHSQALPHRVEAPFLQDLQGSLPSSAPPAQETLCLTCWKVFSLHASG